MSRRRSFSRQNGQTNRKSITLITKDDKVTQVKLLVGRTLGALGSAKRMSIQKEKEKRAKKVTFKKTSLKSAEKDKVTKESQTDSSNEDESKTSEESMPPYKKLVIPVGLCRSATALPLCVLNPGIPLQWYSCRKCTRVFQTAVERDEHKTVHKKSLQKRERSKEKRLDTQNGETSSSSIKNRVATPLKISSSKDTSKLRGKGKANSVSSDDDPPMKKARTVPQEVIISPSAKRIPCDCCSETFSTRKDLQRHKILQSNNKHDKTISLGTPPKPSTVPLDDERVDIPNGADNYICPHCHKDFEYPDTLKRHLRTHENSDSQDQNSKMYLVSPRAKDSRKLLSGQRSARQLAASGKSGPKKTPRRNIIQLSQLESLSPEQIF